MWKDGGETENIVIQEKVKETWTVENTNDKNTMKDIGPQPVERCQTHVSSVEDFVAIVIKTDSTE